MNRRDETHKNERMSQQIRPEGFRTHTNTRTHAETNTHTHTCTQKHTHTHMQKQTHIQTHAQDKTRLVENRSNDLPERFAVKTCTLQMTCLCVCAREAGVAGAHAPPTRGADRPIACADSAGHTDTLRADTCIQTTRWHGVHDLLRRLSRKERALDRKLKQRCRKKIDYAGKQKNNLCS